MIGHGEVPALRLRDARRPRLRAEGGFDGEMARPLRKGIANGHELGIKTWNWHGVWEKLEDAGIR